MSDEPTAKHYVFLMKLSEPMRDRMGQLPRVMDEIAAAWEELTGSPLTVLATLGVNDLVAFGDAADDQMAAFFAFQLASNGAVQSTTSQGYTSTEVGSVLGQIPIPTMRVK